MRIVRSGQPNVDVALNLVLRKKTGRSSALQVLPDAGCSSAATLYMSGSNLREMRIIPCRYRIFMGHTEKLVATFLIRIDRQILPGQLLQFGTYVRLLFGDL